MPRPAALPLAVLLALAGPAFGQATPVAGAPADPAQAELRDGFEGTDFAPEGGLYYRENAEQAAGTVTFEQEVVHQGKGALKLSVRPTCPAEAEGCSERAEIWEATALRVPYETPVWHHLAMRYDNPPDKDHRYVMAQWKREILPTAKLDYSPFLALRMRSGQAFATVETDLVAPPADAPRPVAGQCPAGWTPVSLRPEEGQMRFLVAVSEGWQAETGPEYDHCSQAISRRTGAGRLPGASEAWHDYAFYARPDAQGRGRVAIFADGALVVDVQGRIGHDDDGLGPNQYFKFGPYRDAGQGSWTMYYDDYRRSPRCAAVLPEAACRDFDGH